MSNIKLNHNINQPGVNVVTSLDPTTRVYDTNRGMKIMAVFAAERGPVNQRVVCTTIEQFKATYGKYRNGTYGYPLADVLFGADSWTDGYSRKLELHCVRVADPNATKASYTIVDTAGVDTGKFTAKNVGPWGNNIQVQVTAGTKTDYIDKPAAGPTLTTAAEGGTIATGTFEVVYCYNNVNGDTLISDSSSVTFATGSTNKITVTAHDVLPYGVDKIKAFVKVSSNWRLAATSTSGSNTVDITAIPTGGANQNVSTNGCTMPSRKIALYYNGTHINTWDNMKMDSTDIQIFNTSQMYVDYEDLASVTAEPGNLPAVMATTHYLSGGTDDLTALAAADFVGASDPDTGKTGLQIFRDEELGTGIILCPGITDSTVHDALVDIAEDYYRIALLDLPANSTPQDVYDWVDDGDISSEHAQVVYPWFNWENPYWRQEQTDQRILMPISMQFAGAYAWSAMNKGPYAAPAGKRFRLRACPSARPTINLAGGLAKDAQGNEMVDQSILNNLNNDYRVSCAIRLPRVGPVIYSEVLRCDNNLITRAHECLALNRIFYNIRAAYEASGLIFETLNAMDLDRLFMTARNIAKNVLKDVYMQGGLIGVAGDSLSADFNSACRVECSSRNNPLTDLQQGILNIDVYWYNVPVIEALRIALHPRNLTDGLN